MPPDAHEIVPLSVWRSLREFVPPNDATTRGPFGVLLEAGDDPRELAPDFERIDVVAIRFPSFSDGRGYSTARLLRQQLGWRGMLLAVGDVLRDQLLLMERCGFDAMWLRADQDADEALSAFGDFSDAYQASAASVPLFQRRGRLAGVNA